MNVPGRPEHADRLAGQARPGASPFTQLIGSHALAEPARARVTTRRDPYGRILAPVRINDAGPFGLVVNSGASAMTISQTVAHRLGLSLDEERPIVVHGVTGTDTMPVVRLRSISVGGMALDATTAVVLPNGPEGAEGMLGLMGLACGNIRLELRQQQLWIANGVSAGPGSPDETCLPMDPAYARLIVVNTSVRGVAVKAVIDTGAQSTIGNLALQLALGSHGEPAGAATPITGPISQRRTGFSQLLHPISIGSLRVLGLRICYSQVPLFDKVGLGSVPAMLLGMDVLSRMNRIGFDFLTRTLHLEPPA